VRSIVAALGMVGCVAGPTCDVEGPAAALVCDGAEVAELGTDIAGEFEVHPPGAPLELVRGEQGLQHVELDVWLALDPDSWRVDRALVQAGAWRTDDGAEVVPLDSWGVGLSPDGDATRVRGLRWVFPDREAAVGARVEVAVRVMPVGLDRAFTAWTDGEVRLAE
jgi:hypothetical protein